jgi:putative hydrolase of the HAD superfamily
VEDYEQGLISEERFKSHIDKEIGRILSKTEFETAWNAIIKEIPEPRVRLLESLASQYNLYLLSNTNSIHYRYYTSQFRQTFGRELQSLFTKTYFSYQIKMRKPNEDIFEFVAKDAAIQKPETLFIDDSPLNIDTAQKLGFKTFHKPQQEEITQFF